MRVCRKGVEEVGEMEEGKGVTMGVVMGVSMGVSVGRAVGVAILAWRMHQLEEEYIMGGQDVDTGDKGAW